MSFPLYQVDAFTSTPCTGNPAAVCVLRDARNAPWMQRIAGEMNLSETAFLRPQPDGSFRLRWFTPTHEVNLCGHATLASAHVLWTEGLLAVEAAARFDTASGRLTARREEEWIYMDFPADPVEPTEPPSALLDGLNDARPEEVGWSGRDYLVRLSDATAVQHLQPDLSTLATLEDARGVIVTAPGPTEKGRPPATSQAEDRNLPAPQETPDDSEDADFVSRFFAPRVGVPEDPVTGSAHCALGPYWGARTGRTSLTGRQVSPRGGTVRVHLDPDERRGQARDDDQHGEVSAERVTLAGRATTVLHGRLAI